MRLGERTTGLGARIGTGSDAPAETRVGTRVHAGNRAGADEPDSHSGNGFPAVSGAKGTVARPTRKTSDIVIPA